MRYRQAAAVVVAGLIGSASPAWVQAQAFTQLGSTSEQLQVQTGDPLRVAGNVAVFDSDGDGDLDLLWTAAAGQGLWLDRNIGSPAFPRFTESTATAGFATGGDATQGFGLGDFDGDGLVDVYVAQDGSDQLYLSQPDGTFVDATTSHLGGDGGLSTAVAVADFDGDADLDIYVARYVSVLRFPFHEGDPNLLLVNDGRGRFTDRAADWGLDDVGSALAATWSDVDEDGDLDLLLVNDFGPSGLTHRAWRNDGPAGDADWQFTDVGSAWGFDRCLYGMGIGAFDADRDGHLDYYLTSIGRHVLLAGPADPALVEVTDELGVANTFGATAFRSSWGTATLDATGDGLDDLYVRVGSIPAANEIETSFGQTDRLWTLGPGGQLRDAWLDLFPFGLSRAGRGVVAADVNGDGQIDVVAGSANDSTRVYLGALERDPVAVTLAPSVSGPGAPGARFWLTCDAIGGVLNLRQHFAGGSLGSAPPPGREWMPIPAVCGDEATLHVAWPTGARSTLAVEPGLTVTAVEPEWLVVDPAALPAGSGDLVAVSVSPYAADGLPLGPGHEVSVELQGATAALGDLGDGEYVGSLTAPALPGTYRLDVFVDGERLPVTRWLRATSGADAHIHLHPARPIVDQPLVITVSMPGDTSPGLRINGAGAPLELLGPGVGQATYVPTTTSGPLTLQPTLAGEPVGEPLIATVSEPVSVERSYLEVSVPFATTPSGAPNIPIISAYLRDANGRDASLFSGDVRLLIDDESVSFTFRQVAGDRYRIIPDQPPSAGSAIVVEAAGVAFPEVVIRSNDDDADLVPLVTPEQTGFGAFFEACRADASDLLVVNIMPRTADDQPMPEITSIGLDVEGAELIAGPSYERAGMYEATLRCGTEPGTGSYTLTFGGELTEMTRTFLLLEPLEPAPSLPNTDFIVPYTILDPGESASVRLLIRDVAGELVGSGVEAALWVAGLDEWLDLPYCGAGKYCLELEHPGDEAVWTITPYVEGVPAGDGVVIWFRDFDDPEPDDPPDVAYPDAAESGGDTGADPAADAGGDVAADADTGPGDAAADAVDDGPVDAAPPDASGDVARDAADDGPARRPDADAPGIDLGSDPADGEPSGSDVAADRTGNDEGGGEAGSPGDSGCGCGTAARRPARPEMISALACLALVALRRRRRLDV